MLKKLISGWVISLGVVLACIDLGAEAKAGGIDTIALNINATTFMMVDDRVVLAADEMTGDIVLVSLLTGGELYRLSAGATIESIAFKRSAKNAKFLSMLVQQRGGRGYELRGFDIDNDMIWPRSVFSGLVSEFKNPEIQFTERGSNAVVVWDSSLERTTSQYYVITSKTVEPTAKKLYPSKLVPFGQDGLFLGIHPRNEAISLIDIKEGFTEDSISIRGLGSRGVGSLAVFTSDLADGGSGDVAIANTYDNVLTVVSLNATSGLMRISNPIQASTKELAIKSEVVVAANRALSEIVIGQRGDDQLGIYTRSGGGLRGPIKVKMSFKIRAIMSTSHPGGEQDGFAFLDDTGRTIHIVEDLSKFATGGEINSPDSSSDGTQTITIDPDIRSAANAMILQQQLAKLGYSIGAIDGVVGASTYSAIRTFQLDNDLASSGLLNEETVDLLNVAANSNRPDSEFYKQYITDFQQLLDREVGGVDAESLLGFGASNNDKEGKCYQLNLLPPRTLWENAIPFAKILKRLESNFKFNIEILSGYRSSAYSKCIGGEGIGAQHSKFWAFDIRVAGTDIKDSANGRLMALLKSMQKYGELQGGVGFSGASIHVDTRGTNVNFDPSR
ncbi:M15 family metallopeptidase [Rhizobium leguminosarum]|uniref:M15 family metallopeptidase n=1 Tax=Rhizobium leguminosarum TaxID=384 RepID=UPI001C8FE4A8|nr:M15 family metallopeptidase [Rhizobium leguminosarum]MBY2914138.1 hypothetical protein [Rhizobium leguminosarum]MBY2969677.1 hypothetical protein [Rhizobium leguminosarum]MBY2977050.1 hypothetical protein [Rhizobium leguminosarum]MBY3005600.1 hypothetical protein [Rhizobium leguminosarum]